MSQHIQISGHEVLVIFELVNLFEWLKESESRREMWDMLLVEVVCRMRAKAEWLIGLVYIFWLTPLPASSALVWDAYSGEHL
ncbi:DNA/RNA polymerases superfamily protein [Gossypium australe]|uniref:DNA/RNA polymerases superfamily protein n=1 Tax=Gossypium australe TaxID=47621 RepID=A0A5B6VW06_9ROSI|nr:DNA/RNA polymerases superfamily protein [Gossypium australe]